MKQKLLWRYLFSVFLYYILLKFLSQDSCWCLVIQHQYQFAAITHFFVFTYPSRGICCYSRQIVHYCFENNCSKQFLEASKNISITAIFREHVSDYFCQNKYINRNDMMEKNKLTNHYLNKLKYAIKMTHIGFEMDLIKTSMQAGFNKCIIR